MSNLINHHLVEQVGYSLIRNELIGILVSYKFLVTFSVKS